jgi:hypothetical protein
MKSRKSLLLALLLTGLCWSAPVPIQRGNFTLNDAQKEDVKKYTVGTYLDRVSRVEAVLGLCKISSEEVKKKLYVIDSLQKEVKKGNLTIDTTHAFNLFVIDFFPNDPVDTLYVGNISVIPSSRVGIREMGPDGVEVFRDSVTMPYNYYDIYGKKFDRIKPFGISANSFNDFNRGSIIFLIYNESYFYRLRSLGNGLYLIIKATILK